MREAAWGVALDDVGAEHRSPVALMAALAEQAALVGVVGVTHHEGLPFRGSLASFDDDLGGEWSMVVLSPHMAVAVVARQLGSGPAERALYEFSVNHERGLVAACARSLAARLAPIS